MQHTLKQLVLDMPAHRHESETPLELSFAARIKAYPKAELLAAVFGVNPSSAAQDLLVGMPDFIKGLDFEDLSHAFQILEEDELAMHRYRDSLSEVFGIDVDRMSEGKIRSSSRPSARSYNDLSHRQINQQELLTRMQQQGAPMIAATDGSKEALQIAAMFQKRQGHQTHIGPNTPALWYDLFEFVDGPAWIIEAPLPPSTIEGSDTITYVVSVNENCVKYTINSSGFPKFPDRPDYAFTPEELEELREMGFDIID